MRQQSIEYLDGSTTLIGYLAVKPSQEKLPLVLVAHTWAGRDEFVCKKAEALAELGYAGLAIDMFGNAKVGKNVEENANLIQPFMQDRAMLRRRVNAAYNAAKSIDGVDKNRIAAIGFCFGGLCVLDLARSGADLKGVVSFHGLLSAPENLPNETIRAKILALHGYDDPMATHDQVHQFEQEMTTAHVDWQLHMYGNTKHGFTNPQASDQKLGIVYNPIADKRSWQSMKNFLAEIFG